MGAGDAPRPDAERLTPVRRSARGVDRRGSRRRPKPGRTVRPRRCRRPDRGHSARRLGVPSGTCALQATACGLPIRPVLKHGPRSLTCVRVNGRGNP